MHPLVSQLVAMALVLVAFLLGPGLGIAFLIRRKKIRRARGRSPLTKDLLRSPGHSLRDQLDEKLGNLLLHIVGLAVLPLMVLAILQTQHGSLAASPLISAIALAGIVGFVVITVRKMWVDGNRLDDLRAGYDAELAVGQELDQLMRQGARVFHDFPADGFNIDHVLIAPSGLFAIETKGYTKPASMDGRAAATVTFDGKVLAFPTWTGTGPLEQAERQARWLSKWASDAIGERVVAQPVVTLPGWFVERKGRGPVKVMNGGEVGALLSSNGDERLSPQLIQRVAHQVEQRCRNVAPTYVGREGTV